MDESGLAREAPPKAFAGDDRVAWPCIRPGWKVVAADGADVGEVDEIAGDPERDIFDGLAIATRALGKPRYVLAERVGDITEGVVYLTINRSEVDRLREYLEPATSGRIEPVDTRGLRASLRAVRRRLLAPGAHRQYPIALHQRIAHLIRRRRH